MTDDSYQPLRDDVRLLGQLLGNTLKTKVGQELFDVGRIGNGAHNKKYSIMILDEAIGNFEDTIDLLESGD